MNSKIGTDEQCLYACVALLLLSVVIDVCGLNDQLPFMILCIILSASSVVFGVIALFESFKDDGEC